jgi:Protease inhibitor Inh
MLRLLLLLGSLLVLGHPATPAPAQDGLSDAERELIGGFELSTADRERVCTVTFTADPAQVGLKLEFDKACAAAFPFTKDVVAWKLGAQEVLRLIDARGRPVIEFSEVETGMYESERADGIYFMQSVASLGPPPRTAQELIGDWGVVRGERNVCVVTLTPTVFDQDSFVLKVNPGCESGITQFGLASWHMDRGELLLVAPRGVWRFEEVDATSWHRVPDRGDPMFLVRQ